MLYKKNRTIYAPIVIFTYKKYFSLKKLIQSIKKNKTYKHHNLYIFSDAPKVKNEIKKTKRVRNYINKIRGFKKKKIIFREKNFGLASNITSGIYEVLKKEKFAIFLEDDLIVSRNFLSYMNLNLIKYQNTKKVWHISGFNFNIKINSKETQFFTRVANCWGWATWSNRWKNFKKNPNEIINKWSKKKIKKFNFDGTYDFFSQIQRNQNKTLNSWAIFWYSTIFDKQGLCINPIKSLVKNIGIGKGATNTKKLDKILKPKINNTYYKIIFPKVVKENKKIFKSLKESFNSSISKNRLKSFFKYFT